MGWRHFAASPFVLSETPRRFDGSNSITQYCATYKRKHHLPAPAPDRQKR